MAIDSSILAWRIPWTEEPGGHSPQGHRESDMTEWLSTQAHMQLGSYSGLVTQASSACYHVRVLSHFSHA